MVADSGAAVGRLAGKPKSKTAMAVVGASNVIMVCSVLITVDVSIVLLDAAID